MSQFPEDRHPRHHALARLSRAAMWEAEDQAQAFAQVTEVAAEVIRVARVGIWLYPTGRSCIELADLYEAGTGSHSQGMRLRREDYPSYFAAMATDRAIIAEDAQRDPRTAEFQAAYLQPLGIGAMLDAPIFRGGRCAGVICHEHLGGTREWSEEEVLLATSLADYVGLCLEAQVNREVQRELRHREHELRMAMDAAQMGSWQWDIQADVLRWSPRTVAIFGMPAGWQPETHAGYEERIHPADRDQVRERVRLSLETEDEFHLRHRLRTPDGRTRWIEARGDIERDAQGRPTIMRGLVTDISEQRVLEDTLLQAQKMEGIGRLAGGIAHDLNNLLMVFLGNLELLQLQLGEEHPAQSSIQQMQAATDRATGMTRQLLTFAAKQIDQPRPLAVNTQIQAMFQMLERLIGEDVRLETGFDPDNPVVLIDPGHFDQVLLNLVLNARDAMPEGGVLRISTHGAEPGDAVRIRVEDQGCGIPPQHLPRVFEPFFTTKPTGKGTGLGLATSYGIIQSAGGNIEIASEPDEGTRVEIQLPGAELHDARSSADPNAAAFEPDGETLLLVEDEEMVRELLARHLQSKGFEVHCGADCAAGLRAYAELGAQIDIVLSDLVLPDGSGAKMVETMREQGLAAPVLFMTGYSDERAALVEREAMLHKPFSNARLLEALGSLLLERHDQSTT